MDVEIQTKQGNLKFNCETMKAENGFIILINPVWNEKSTKEFWLPTANIEYINITKKE